jgi:crossover junction endodeoxyribonuclease RuvC
MIDLRFMHGSFVLFVAACGARTSHVAGPCSRFVLSLAKSGGAGVRVIGFDPGLRSTGWGVVDWREGRLAHVANGTCTTAGGALAVRLAALHAQIEAVIEGHGPHEAAVELTFVSKDAVATLKLGQARAIALLVPAQRGLAVAEYAPNAVKKAVVGVGHADKRQIQHMVGRLLPGVRLEGPDAADALAVAICHAWTAGTRARVAAAVGAAR